MRLTKLVVLLILTSLAVACVQSNVVRFHNLPKFGNNKTIVVLLSDPGKKGGLEFQVYADLVGGYLKKKWVHGRLPRGFQRRTYRVP